MGCVSIYALYSGEDCANDIKAKLVSASSFCFMTLWIASDHALNHFGNYRACQSVTALDLLYWGIACPYDCLRYLVDKH